MLSALPSRIADFISRPGVVISLCLLLALAASLQAWFNGPKVFVEGGPEYTHYNNYVIFKESFYHLRQGRDLYLLYPESHWDLFKYTPTFAALFGALAWLPDVAGLSLWNLLNALVLLLAVYNLPRISPRQKGLILAVCLIELMTSMQSHQSNAMIAGLLILAFGSLEKSRYSLAALCIVCSVYIKLFGIVGAALFIFYPQQWRLVLYSFAWAAALFAIPLLFIDFEAYLVQLDSYRRMLSWDHSVSYGFSVMGWLQAWFGIHADKLWVVLLGAAGFMAPLFKIRAYRDFHFRMLLLASALLWVVIFNHKAESPTFVIAMAGAALWFVMSKKSALNVALFIFAFVFTSLSPTDIFPRFLREAVVTPYALKAVPCIFIWFKVVYDMLVWKEAESLS